MKPLRLHFFLPLALLLAAVGPPLTSVNNKNFTRPIMLKAMAQNCIAPGLIELADDADALYRASQTLMNKPNRKTLAQAQAAWTKLRLAYKRNEMLAYGPVEDQTFWRANFFELVHPGLTEYAINGAQPIDQNLMERIGGAAKGFTVAEYLLFSPLSIQIHKAGLESGVATNAFTSWFFEGKTAPRRRQYLCAVAQNLSLHLQSVARKARAPDFSGTFAAGGQESVNLLVNQLIVTLESNLILPFRFALNPIFASRPGLSAAKFSGMKMSLEGLQRFYDGGGGPGLAEYLQHVHPSLNERVKAQFNAASKALSALDKPVETMDAAHRPAVEKALDETRKLELLLKVDVVSALGVTIMFNAYDGD